VNSKEAMGLLAILLLVDLNTNQKIEVEMR
jgi:hypothetical protein